MSHFDLFDCIGGVKLDCQIFLMNNSVSKSICAHSRQTNIVFRALPTLQIERILKLKSLWLFIRSRFAVNTNVLEGYGDINGVCSFEYTINKCIGTIIFHFERQINVNSHWWLKAGGCLIEAIIYYLTLQDGIILRTGNRRVQEC